MAFVEGGLEGVLNGATLVDVVAAPGSSTRRLVKNVKFSNRDTVSHTIILHKDKSGTQYEIARETLGANEYWTYSDVIVCDAIDEKIVAKMLAAHTTTAPSFDSAFADAS